ncbi:polysaccharide deacetylase family protein [Flavobacterium sp. W21_SRS_FM6]|uniref:polysaccharide deacetylase family protein n=1 Tax=Flavobacterium sp. W21_SRS_FM6 TaxID=3240268 RepID=UPI003F9354EC
MINKGLWHLLLLVSVFFAHDIEAKDNAVILLYHHVSEQTPAVTSVSPKVFRQHLEYLSAHHQVLPLETVIKAITQGKSLPDKSVVITFDDGYDNIFEQAHPLLKEFGFPYTVFINPPLIGKANYQLSWAQIKKMAQEGATFANHGNTHEHMLGRLPGESDEAWLSRVMDNINQAEQTLAQQLGYSLKYFAYPYGEFNVPLKQALRQQGYVAFAQISGAVASYSDFGALPRYPAAGIYSNINSLKTKLDSLAMPVNNITPDEPLITLPIPDIDLIFDVSTEDLRLSQLSCFVADKTVKLSFTKNTVTVPFKAQQKAGRQRVNCTAPSIKESGRYYWFSQPWFVPTADGQWLD